MLTPFRVALRRRRNIVQSQARYRFADDDSLLTDLAFRRVFCRTRFLVLCGAVEGVQRTNTSSPDCRLDAVYLGPSDRRRCRACRRCREDPMAPRRRCWGLYVGTNFVDSTATRLGLYSATRWDLKCRRNSPLSINHVELDHPASLCSALRDENVVRRCRSGSRRPRYNSRHRNPYAFPAVPEMVDRRIF